MSITAIKAFDNIRRRETTPRDIKREFIARQKKAAAPGEPLVPVPDDLPVRALHGVLCLPSLCS
jgi:hypothetical protein